MPEAPVKLFEYELHSGGDFQIRCHPETPRAIRAAQHPVLLNSWQTLTRAGTDRAVDLTLMGAGPGRSPNQTPESPQSMEVGRGRCPIVLDMIGLDTAHKQ